jgi:hypothetical protein
MSAQRHDVFLAALLVVGALDQQIVLKLMCHGAFSIIRLRFPSCVSKR